MIKFKLSTSDEGITNKIKLKWTSIKLKSYEMSIERQPSNKEAYYWSITWTNIFISWI